MCKKCLRIGRIVLSIIVILVIGVGCSNRSNASSEITENDNVVHEVENDEKNIEINKVINVTQEQSVQLALPDSYIAVVGDTLEIFMSGILNVPDYSNYWIEFESDVSRGKKYKRRWIYTADEDHDDFVLTISVYDSNSNLLAQDSVEIIVVDKIKAIDKEINVACVGDSLTKNGYWVNEFNRRLVSSDGSPIGDSLTNINFVGTQGGKDDVYYEGRGGWRWYNYLRKGKEMYWIKVSSAMKTSLMYESIWSDGENEWVIETIDKSESKIKLRRNDNDGTYILPSKDTLTYVKGGKGDTSDIVYTSVENTYVNPFYNVDTDELSFSNYCKVAGAKKLDYMIILLGWNSVKRGILSDDIIADGKRFVDALHAEFPNCKVIISGLQQPSEDGYGACYGIAVTNGSLIKYREFKNAAFELNAAYQVWCNEPGYSDFMYFSDLSGQFDLEYGYPISKHNVNIRSEEKEKIQVNSIHPSNTYNGETGELQIADSIYRMFHYVIGTEK